ncbi:transcriptional regulator, GntR family [Rhizobiales bacterium GAS191]|nr:transcriptional regulator, GntR family [Rhizobiales bacterium GAS191]
MKQHVSTRSPKQLERIDTLLGLDASNRSKRNRPLVIAEVLKDWIAEHGLKSGDRLPQERELIGLFGVSKGTVREALKVLDAQGIIKTRTGPGGGAFIAPVTESGALELLGNYFFFKGLTIGDIYELRIRLEPEAIASVAGRLSEPDFAQLESKMKVYDHPPTSIEEERQQRLAELEFHELLIGYCPNPLMTFACRFLISLLKNLTICRRIYDIPNPELREHGRSYQLRLMTALRKGNAAAARRIMDQHMRYAGHMMEVQEAFVARQFLKVQ